MWGRKKGASTGKGGRPGKRRPPFRRRLLSAAPVILGSILLTLLYGDAAFFRRMETMALDFTMLASAPTGNSDVVIVRITDDDYRTYFGGKSPLNPAQLRDLIDTIVSAGPKVIGVDLDTSAEAFQSFQVPQEWHSVVWASNATYSNVHRKYLLSGVLGKKPPTVPFGLVTLRLDSDGAIRRYTRFYDTGAGTAASSLPWAMLKKFRDDNSSLPAAPDFKEEFLINYPGPPESTYFFWIPVSKLYEMSAQGGLGKGNLFEGKMVILGGDYSAQDEHDTPVGWMTGPQILASIIETEQQGGGQKPLGTFVIILFAIIDSVILLLLIHRFGLWKTLLISIAVVPLLALLLSLLFSGSSSYTGVFLLVMIAVLAHQVYEKGKEYFKKWREQAAEEIK